MLEIIDDKTFQNILSKSQIELNWQVNPELLENDALKEPLKKYLALTYHKDKFVSITPLSAYYNRYYWYVKFRELHKSLLGDDVSIEQQEFKIIEEGGEYPDIDWSVIEEISNKLKL